MTFLCYEYGSLNGILVTWKSAIMDRALVLKPKCSSLLQQEVACHTSPNYYSIRKLAGPGPDLRPPEYESMHSGFGIITLICFYYFTFVNTRRLLVDISRRTSHVVMTWLVCACQQSLSRSVAKGTIGINGGQIEPYLRKDTSIN
ncbi:hypothetical protein LSH36_626g01001 [Paralvinella palmiformis]|uniref:Uncharacterized protein n=1 Tax=Paralvinella palmiformis TaxID=53620 RepID=A0AAD9J5E1_9ANNE|nr:hypothetical protein LSH36_626g01001 [Paralvinella palmiformis]